MISWIISGLGGLTFLIGIVWLVVSWVQKPQAQQAIRTIDALTPGDISQYFKPVAPQVSRIEALTQADALMTYFEATGSVSGQKAVQDLVQSIFAAKVVK